MDGLRGASRGKKCVGDIFLILFGTVVGVVATEAVLRVFPLIEDSYPVRFRVDRDYKYHYLPNQSLVTIYGHHITINRWGLRSTAVPEPRNDATHAVYRVLILGDSVAFGYGVDDKDIYTRRLAAFHCLSRKRGRRVQVINGGCEGYNTFNELAWYRKQGMKFRPDEVWLLYVSNDPATRPNRIRYIAPNGMPTQHPSSIIPLTLRFYLRESALVMLVHQTWEMVRPHEALSPAQKRKALDASLGALTRLENIASKNGKIRIFYIPCAEEVRGGPPTPARSFVIATAIRRGYRVADLTAQMKALLARGNDPFLPEDPIHLSPAGHEVLAQVLASEMDCNQRGSVSRSPEIDKTVRSCFHGNRRGTSASLRNG